MLVNTKEHMGLKKSVILIFSV